MISYLKGKILFTNENNLSVLVNDVGWDVYVFDPLKYIDEVALYVHTHYRESEISLWGFDTLEELKLFKMLISVSGVGPKIGMSLIGNKGVKSILFSVLNEDANSLKVSGVGLKTSQKIVIELKEKISKIYTSDMLPEKGEIPMENNFELKQALLALGYQHADIENFIKKIQKEGLKEKSTEELIKYFLRSA